MQKKKLVALGGALAVMTSLATMAGAGTPARAAQVTDTTSPFWCGNFDASLSRGECYSFDRPNGNGVGQVWLGTYTGPSWEAWCIDFLYGTDFSVPGARETVASIKNSSGTTIGNSEKAALAYLATKYSPASVDDRDAAAISLIIREVMSDGYSNGSGAQIFPGGLTVGGTVQAPLGAIGINQSTLDRANELWADASKWVGVWTVVLSQPATTTMNPGGKITYVVTVKSGTGVPVAGEQVGVSYNNATGPTSVTTDQNGQANIDVSSLGSGDWGVDVTAQSPGTDPELWTPNDWTGTSFGSPSSSTQRVLGTAAPKVIAAKASGWTNYVGSIGTTAVDASDGDKFLPAAGGQVKDTVAYTGLQPGLAYTVSGELMDQATGDATGLKASTTFTPTASDGTVDVTFDVPASQAGKALVAFETVTDSAGNLAASHTDIGDGAQTVYLPQIGTTAVDASDGDKSLPLEGGTITDTVAYSGLQPGQTYTVNGELFSKQTGASTGITATASFTPTTADGTTDVTFTVPAGFAGTDLVAYETLLASGAALASHSDINDAAQTVAVAKPQIGTTAVDASDGDKYLPAAGGQVKDTIAYSGLTPGQTYTASGELMDAATGTSTGLKGSATFTPASPSGTVDVTFDVPASQAGKALVAFETVSDSAGTEISSHKDLADAAQTVYVPQIGTTAVDASDGDKVIPAEGGTVTDTVAYAGLIPGQAYSVSGELWDKASGKTTGITGQATFTPASADGTVGVSFDVPAGMKGATLVAFETVTAGTTTVAAHTDINDAAQAVTVAAPTLATTAVDQADGDKYLPTSGGTVKDTVAYTDLTVGKEYTVTGELTDKATGQPTGVKASTTFTPASPSGTVDVTFDVPASQAGKTLVAFESVSVGGTEVAAHADINDAGQTVSVPTLATTAVDQADGDKALPTSGGTVKDTVAYEGLIPGQAYTVTGELMDKATGQSTGITGTADFTPTSPDGTVDVLFTVPADLGGKKLVAFETVVQAGAKVADHADINDAAQTVSIDEFAPGITNNPGLPMTGGPGTTGALAGLGAVLAGAVGMVTKRLRRHRD